MNNLEQIKKQSEDYRRLKRDFLIVNVTVGIVLLFASGWLLLQQYHVEGTLPCIIHDWLHIYCPGCGGTQAFFALLRGNILESLSSNPGLLLGGLLGGYYEVGVLFTLIKRNGKRYYTESLLPVYVFLILFLGYVILRDILLGFGIDLLGDFISA